MTWRMPSGWDYDRLSTAQIVLQLYLRAIGQKFRLAADMDMAQTSRRMRSGSGRGGILIRCRSGMRRLEQTLPEQAAYPLHAVTQRPMAMYHAWHSQNAWLRQIYSYNRLYMAIPADRGGAGDCLTMTGCG